MAIEQQPPDVLAMVLADAVLRDLATKKHTIQGIYTLLHVREFPYLHPFIVVYTALTNGHGQTLMQLRLVDANEERAPLFTSESSLLFPDPLYVAEAVFAVPNVVFPEPGEYRLQLFGAGQPIRERRLYIGRTEEPPGP
jgi:hypothetical protein